MGDKILENAYPTMHSRIADRIFTEEEFQKKHIPIDSREIFDHIRDIKDPEHPMTLEELGVVDLDLVKVNEEKNHCYVEFKPTIPHCSMATLIGLSIKVHLLRILPPKYKVDVKVVSGTHVSYAAINKQLADKERISAALENKYLLDVINDCIMMAEPQTLPKFVEIELKNSNSLHHPKIEYIQLSRQHIESYRRWRDILQIVTKKAA